ncbi:MAG: secretin N-terminal domain-containing protein [Verrucomicrobiota bacterium]
MKFNPLNVKPRLLAAALFLSIVTLLFWCAPPSGMAQNTKRITKKKQRVDSAAAVTNTTAATAKPDSEVKKAVATDSSDSSQKPADVNAAMKKDGAGKIEMEGSSTNSSTNEIQLSFQGANIDMIVQWLAQTTGKSVVKHPKVQCQLTIVGSKKVAPREALNLVYRALALEGFSVVESSKSILIVPEGQEPKTSPELLSSSRSGLPEGRQRLVKVFTLKYIQAADVKERIKTLLSEKATADVDERANQIIVTDYTDNIAVIGDLINVLDADRPEDTAVRMIPLKNVSAQDLSREIGPLFQKMNAKSPKEGASKETIEVSANERSNSLIILSSEANFRGIQKLVATLDTEDAVEKITKTFQLRNAEAADVAKQLQDLNQDQDSSPRFPFFFYSSSMGGGNKSGKKMTVVADRRRNTIIVQAPPAQMDNLTKIVAALDEAVDDDSLAPKIFPLKYVSAGDIEDILNELFLKRQAQRSYWNPYNGEPEPQGAGDRDVGRLYGKVRVTSESHANALIITANSAENLAAVEAVVRQLDVPSDAGETTFRIGLKFAKASTVANSINILFAKGGAPALRPVTPPGQQANPTPQQQQNSSARASFELEREAKEEGYFPWLGGQPENARSADGRNALRTASDLVGRVRIVPDQRSNSLLVSANVHFFPQVLKLIEDLDAPTAQVLIEAKIVEVSTDYLDRLGVRWSPDGSKTFTADDFDNSLIASSKGRYQKGFGANTTVNSPSSSTIASALTSLRSGTLESALSMEFLVQFLRKTTDATVLAEPQINISDNELGKLFVGQQVPTLTAQNNPALGGTTQNFEYRDVGVILEVTPHINDLGDVALKIRAESSVIVPGQTLFGGAIFDTRNFKTDLTAKDGQTLVLGGIIQKQTSDTLRKTPILGSLPGLKWAFNKKDKTSRQVELMVFLRTKIVRSPEQARELMEEIERKTPLIKKLQNGPADAKEKKQK